MKIKKIVSLLITICVALAGLGGCSPSPNKERTQEALDKLNSLEAYHLKSHTTVSLASGNRKTDIETNLDLIITDEAACSSSWMSASGVGFSTDLYIEMQQYFINDRIYVSCPQLTDKYIDMSSTYTQNEDNTARGAVEAFGFDVNSTQFKYLDTTIKREGKEIDVLMAVVIMDDTTFIDFVRNVYAQQNASYNSLDETDIAETIAIFEEMEVESADFSLFIDDDNNILRLFLSAVLTKGRSGQKTTFSFQSVYDIIETGDSVTLELPDIQASNVIDYNTLIA